jgi:glucose/mannose transport system substrate-binding protein
MRKYDDARTVSRRTYLRGAGVAGAAGLGVAPGYLEAAQGDALEVLHGWTGGDGQRAINALTSRFKKQHSDMNTNFRPIGGGGNVNLNSVVARRLANDNPPSSFANWPGKNLLKYEGVLMDIEESVWNEAGLKDVMVDAAQQRCRLDGTYVCVPIGSHRMNNLFYNTEVVEEAGVDPGSLSGMGDLTDALDQVQQNTDAVPLTHAMKAPWTNVQLWVEVLLSQEGVDAYTKYVNGNGDEEAVRNSLQSTKQILTSYINEDASTIDFTTANQKLIAGDAAFIHQGNWVYGMYRSAEDFQFQRDWGWTAFPGTSDTYVFHLDAFLAPSNNPSPQKTATWERFVGEKEAQVAFNERKGSVPLRNDVDPNRLPEFLGLTLEDLNGAEQLPPTLAHGLAVSPEKLGNVKSAFGDNFMGPFNVDQATQALMEAV